MKRTRLILMAALLTVTGCGGSSGAGEAPPRYLNPTGSCPGIDATAQTLTDQPLPEQFQPVSAVLCAWPPAGVPSPAASAGAAPTIRRSTGPFDDLLQALRTPPPEPSGKEIACPAMLQARRLRALTDAAGRTVLPAIPATECGLRLPAVDAAVQALSWS